jgi:alanyl-tRNA synthetase
VSSADVRTHSALHVLKGAVVNVLGPRKTASVHVADRRGRLTVEMERKPTAEEVGAIEARANRKIAENAEVLQFEMERPEAEGHFGTAIYDAFPVPEVKRLAIVRIPDWEVNCCSARHVDTTGELIGIKVDGVRFRKSKGLLEIEFHLQG